MESTGNNVNLQMASELECRVVGQSPKPVGSDAHSLETVSELGLIIGHRVSVGELLSGMQGKTPRVIIRVRIH